MHGIRSFVGGALGIAASIALTALGLTGCFETPQPSCAFQCGAGGSCPDNYSCRPDNMCKLAGVADDFACPNVPTGGIDAGPDAEPADAADVDAMSVDAMPIDAAPIDAMPIDAMPIDAMPIDAMPIDAAPAALTITTASPLAFGQQTVATTAMMTVDVSNSGGVATSAITVGISGDAEFSLVAGGSDTCSTQTLAPAATCHFDVSFTPATTTTYTGLVTVSATTGGAPMIAVTGEGI